MSRAPPNELEELRAELRDEKRVRREAEQAKQEAEQARKKADEARQDAEQKLSEKGMEDMQISGPDPIPQRDLRRAAQSPSLDSVRPAKRQSILVPDSQMTYPVIEGIMGARVQSTPARELGTQMSTQDKEAAARPSIDGIRFPDDDDPER